MSQHHQGRAATTYVEQDILNESPLALIARLYEMTGVEIARARASLAAGRMAVKGVAVSRAVRCISLLQSSLNMEKGEEVSKNLDRLYRYMLGRISDGHLRNDDEALAEVSAYVAELGAAWRQAASRNEVPLTPARTEASEVVAAR